MLLEILLFIFLGICIGTFAGLCPGIHINTTIPLLLSLAVFIDNPLSIAVLVVSVSVTEMFVDQIPAIFLGSPDADTALCVLPGHRLLFEGRGYEAIKLTVVGGMGALIMSLVFIAVAADIFSAVYDVTRPYIHFLILGVIAFMVLSEKTVRKIAYAALIILMTGLLGVLTLNSAIVRQNDVLFPVLTGLFGLSSMLISLSGSRAIPEQGNENELRISNKCMMKSVLMASFAGIMVGFLPAVGISEAAVMMQYLSGGVTSRGFLMTTAGINVANDAFSLISLYLVGNPRSGASVAIQRVVGEPTLFETAFLVGVIVFTASIAAVLTLFLGKRIPKFLARINYRMLTSSVIVFIVGLVFVITGAYGLLILAVSTSIGLLCAFLEIRRSHCMGVLLVPTTLFFLGLNPITIFILNI
jgi:putative membrane protein